MNRLSARRWATCGVAAAATALASMTCAQPALSTPTGRQSAPEAKANVVLVCGSLPWTVSEDALREAVARELGVEIVNAPPAGGAIRGTLTLGSESGQAYARFSTPDGTVTERSVPLPSDADRALTVLVVLAGNVARDEAAELRAELTRQVDGQNTASETAPDLDEAAPEDPPDEPALDPEESPPIDAPPQVEEGPSPERKRPLPRGRLVVRIQTVSEVGCSAAADKPVYLAGADFLPMVGTSIASREAVLYASLNVVGGLSGGVLGAQIGSVFNIVTGPVCGLQIAGVANVAGHTSGLRIAGVADIAMSARGAQIAGVANVTESADGLQIAGVGNVVRRVDGLQIGGVVNAVRDVKGAQIAGAFNVTGPASGLQLAGALNLAGDVKGVQIGGAGNFAWSLRGLQMGAINVAGSVKGAQIGAVNVAGKVSGLQIGAVNVADSADASIGAVSFVRKGRSHIDVWGSESGLIVAAFKHGGRYFHNFYGFGVRPVGETARLAFTLGLGAHIPVSSRFFMDIDGLAYSVHHADDFKTPPAVLAQLRSMIGVRIIDGLAITAGPSFNVGFAGTDEDADLSAVGGAKLLSAESVKAHAWPGFTIGAQML